MFSIFSELILLIIWLILSINQLIDAGRVGWSIEKNATFWRDQGRLSIEEALNRRENTRIAKNVIMFLGDGMGVTTVTAGRIRKGQVRGELGEDFITEMEQFTYLGLAKTYVKSFN
jgi:alkaline phosphatase